MNKIHSPQGFEGQQHMQQIPNDMNMGMMMKQQMMQQPNPT
jgi:hypothetical protein